MSHLDEGILLTIRDRGLVDADARHHAETCATCASALDDLTARRDAISDALDALTGSIPIDVESAKAEVRRRLDDRRERIHRRWPGPTAAIGRAAILLLLASGVVYALPGSPLRGWIERVTTPGTVVSAEGGAGSEGLEMVVPASGLRIVLASFAPGQQVEVAWIDGALASMVAPPGSRYAVSSDAAEVFAAEGTVRFALPRTGGPVSLEVDGRMVLRRAEGRVEVLGDVVSSGPDRIVFSVGER